MGKTYRYDPDGDQVSPTLNSLEGHPDAVSSVSSGEGQANANEPGEVRPGTMETETEDAATRRQRPFPRVRTFARRGDRMGETLEKTFEKYKYAYLLDVKRGVGPTMVAEGERIDPRVVFGREAPLIVEVGCGNGEQIVRAAAEHPENNYLGFEVWLPGVAKIVSAAVRNHDGLPNLKVADVDALQSLPILLAPGTVHEMWTFFADPWPKTRHHKRRLVAPEFAGIVAELLEDGGRWRLATDWDDYAWQQRDVVESTPGLLNPHRGERPDPNDPEGACGGFAPRFDGRVVTAFERRAGREGREVHDLCVVRLARGSAEEREQIAGLQVLQRLGRLDEIEKPAVSDFQPAQPWYQDEA